MLTRKATHPNDTRDGESSGASYLKPSRDPFKLGLSESLDKELRQANETAIEQGTFKMFQLNADGTKTDITQE